MRLLGALISKHIILHEGNVCYRSNFNCSFKVCADLGPYFNWFASHSITYALRVEALAKLLYTYIVLVYSHKVVASDFLLSLLQVSHRDAILCLIVWET